MSITALPLRFQAASRYVRGGASYWANCPFLKQFREKFVLPKVELFRGPTWVTVVERLGLTLEGDIHPFVNPRQYQFVRTSFSPKLATLAYFSLQPRVTQTCVGHEN